MSPATRAHRTQPSPPPPAYSVLLAAAAIVEVKAKQEPGIAHLPQRLWDAADELGAQTDRKGDRYDLVQDR